MTTAKPKKPLDSPLSYDLLALPDVLVAKPNKDSPATPLILVKTTDFATWIKKQPTFLQNQLTAQNWTAEAGQIGFEYAENGILKAAYVGVSAKIGLYSICAAVEKLPTLTYDLVSPKTTPEELSAIATGWMLTSYRFALYKKMRSTFPSLVWPAGVDKTRVMATARAIYLVRNLVNLPPNALGPQALSEAALMVARNFGATSRVIEDADLLTENFPLIYGVGDGSERRPRLVEFTWGNPKHPHVTFVGKGVCFDTGGYDLKPASAMLLMKKDMGGAAMALGTAFMVMSMKLPIYLRVLIPTVENSVSGRAYRPSDILKSRKGLTVEIGNTDAEGRLVMADCLSYASETPPDLLIDFSTLTGAARAALGYELPAMYANDDKLAADLQKLSMQVEDPVWHMPLWQPYVSDVMSPVADLSNNGSNPAGSVTAALFLQHFVGDGISWIHLDHYAWEATGKAGRPKGGADTGMRAIFALLEKKYGKQTSKSKGRK